MGWFTRLFGAKDSVAEGPAQESRTVERALEPEPGSPVTFVQPPFVATNRGGYAVIDVETTGLSPRRDRVVSIGVVLLNPRGDIEHEWSSLVDPRGPVGATHIHGIRDVDVVGAPTFDLLVPQLIGLLDGRAIVGHNVAFDTSFLRFEFGRAKWSFPTVACVCTLEESFRFLPYLDRRRLGDCCWAAGIELTNAHSALDDARAAAGLLRVYLSSASDHAALVGLRSIVGVAATTRWPAGPGVGLVADPLSSPRELSGRARAVMAAASVRRSTLLETFTLTDALDDGAPAGALPYLEMLAEVLEDGAVTDDERDALTDMAELYELDDRAVAAAHVGLVRALAREAFDDGVLTRAERAELHQIAALLGVPSDDVGDLLDGAEEARLHSLSANLRPLPSNWSLGRPLHVGQPIAITGCEEAGREELERNARAAGLRIAGSVSRRTTLLVTDGTVAGTKAAAAAKFSTRRVSPSDFSVLVAHIQPRVINSSASRPSLRASVDLQSASTIVTVHAPAASQPSRPSPSAVRSWARAQGYDVGARGRLSAELWDEYAAAHLATE